MRWQSSLQEGTKEPAAAVAAVWLPLGLERAEGASSARPLGRQAASPAARLLPRRRIDRLMPSSSRKPTSRKEGSRIVHKNNLGDGIGHVGPWHAREIDGRLRAGAPSIMAIIHTVHTPGRATLGAESKAHGPENKKKKAHNGLTQLRHAASLCIARRQRRCRDERPRVLVRHDAGSV